MTDTISLPSGAARLVSACTELNLVITSMQIEKLLKYVQQLAFWNKTYNLTAVRDPNAMLVHHIFDSLSVLPSVDLFLSGFALPDRYVIDVGSGAGLPGVVLAAMMPDTRVECVDTVEKKVSFIRQMAGVLDLPNLSATHARVETLPPKNAALVISRAFASLQDFISLSQRHVGAHGALLAMKGQHPAEELKAIDASQEWAHQEAQALLVPELQAHRCMIWLNRKPRT